MPSMNVLLYLLDSCCTYQSLHLLVVIALPSFFHNLQTGMTPSFTAVGQYIPLGVDVHVCIDL